MVFYEITRNAIREAISQPRHISQDLVNAQQARRALDYLVGFNLSPLLWKKAGLPGASAGRVQSPALRMICEREEEIARFKAREYWTVDADVEKVQQTFPGRLIELRGEKVEQFTVTNEQQAAEVRAAIEAAAAGKLSVSAIERKQRRRNPAPPFTTSTLQQESARKLGFGAQRTMRLAQQLYEGSTSAKARSASYVYAHGLVELANEPLEIRQSSSRTTARSRCPIAARLQDQSKNAQERTKQCVRPPRRSRRSVSKQYRRRPFISTA